MKTGEPVESLSLLKNFSPVDEKNIRLHMEKQDEKSTFAHSLQDYIGYSSP